MTAPLHPEEAARLAVVNRLGILDSPPEFFSESIATAAASFANTPMSAISIVDHDRQWFKAAIGLDEKQTSRAISFCAHAILSADPLLVLDASTDDRFHTNPLVTGAPNLRFYAGFPLIVRGHAIGALCVLDDRPRAITAQQLEQLALLASGTSAWLTRWSPKS